MKEIYQLKVTLLDSDPAIWRQVLVASDELLQDVHKIIQTTMGWTNSHLHQFVSNDKFYCQPSEDDYPNKDQIDYNGVTLGDLLSTIGHTMLYEYDFGDGWEHEIKLENKLPEDGKMKYPRCIAGERNCPPEDCGGTGGLEKVLEALKNPEDEESKATLKWIGHDYDPSFFDLNEINEMLETKDYGCITIEDE
jgi:hypothetical protein